MFGEILLLCIADLPDRPWWLWPAGSELPAAPPNAAKTSATVNTPHLKYTLLLQNQYSAHFPPKPSKSLKPKEENPCLVVVCSVWEWHTAACIETVLPGTLGKEFHGNPIPYCLPHCRVYVPACTQYGITTSCLYPCCSGQDREQQLVPGHFEWFYL